jgi:hypothetical protein
MISIRDLLWSVSNLSCQKVPAPPSSSCREISTTYFSCTVRQIFFWVQDLPNYEFFLQSSGFFCSVSLVLYPLSSVAVIGSGAKPLHLMCWFCQKQKNSALRMLGPCWGHESLSWIFFSLLSRVTIWHWVEGGRRWENSAVEILLSWQQKGVVLTEWMQVLAMEISDSEVGVV